MENFGKTLLYIIHNNEQGIKELLSRYGYKDLKDEKDIYEAAQTLLLNKKAKALNEFAKIHPDKMWLSAVLEERIRKETQVETTLKPIQPMFISQPDNKQQGYWKDWREVENQSSYALWTISFILFVMLIVSFFKR